MGEVQAPVQSVFSTLTGTTSLLALERVRVPAPRPGWCPAASRGPDTARQSRLQTPGRARRPCLSPLTSVPAASLPGLLCFCPFGCESEVPATPSRSINLAETAHGTREQLRTLAGF